MPMRDARREAADTPRLRSGRLRHSRVCLRFEEARRVDMSCWAASLPRETRCLGSEVSRLMPADQLTSHRSTCRLQYSPLAAHSGCMSSAELQTLRAHVIRYAGVRVVLTDDLKSVRFGDSFITCLFLMPIRHPRHTFQVGLNLDYINSCLHRPFGELYWTPHCFFQTSNSSSRCAFSAPILFLKFFEQYQQYMSTGKWP